MPQVGFLAPDFLLPDSSGELTSLSSLKGRPVLVNIWASWCLPCRSEMPAMQRLYNEYSSRGFTILAVNATNQDNLEQIENFIQENNLTFPIFFDQKGSVSNLYNVRSLPSSFFIDEEGIIQDVVIGGMPESLLRIRIEELLKKWSPDKEGN